MRKYDPLTLEELGRNAARALMAYPAESLPPEESFPGPGIYTLHYSGDFEAYAGLDAQKPIYVGKAETPGRRQGAPVVSGVGSVLYSRLRDHTNSIRATGNLKIGDFHCRWLVLDSVWINLTEQVLIGEYKPLWNVTIDGFGNHDPGKGRRKQQRSAWDTLHPGREWARGLADLPVTAAEIAARAEAHLKTA